ncbi:MULTISPECIES: elongation factor P hydroxylase [unclassified Hahella]|uniref:elongation factor P hydroxylase n=1 Tax=unclassified Hahella TaxID=2624107 RepID=UPI001C1E9567|nr:MULTISPECIES: elongation factor P hydroxylase [unclassified Hahella]MBU6954425.1 elongation factor P hydroxylase [Hahella sp. HN01]MDG9667410.1 elongation factor P hydroxylase [Hahella sp. CR1]
MPAATAHDLQLLFDGLFRETLNTVLVRGEGEPIYLPASATGGCNEIHFAHGFVNSALHEISHWCIAGEARRKLTDYGYWYEPDGRSAQRQAEFERVEVKPQALEWILAEACGIKFFISFDNLDGQGAAGEEAFKAAVHEQARRYLQEGLPPRAQQLLDCFLDTYLGRENFGLSLFALDKL